MAYLRYPDIPMIYQWYNNDTHPVDFRSAALVDGFPKSHAIDPELRSGTAMPGDDRRWPASVKMVKSEVMHCCSGSWYILIHRGVEILNQKQLLINMVGLMFRVRLKGYVLTMWLHCLNCKCSHYTAKRLRARHDVDYPLASPTVALDCIQLLICLDHSCSICVPLESYATKKYLHISNI
jgi:hypothetical protein